MKKSILLISFITLSLFSFSQTKNNISLRPIAFNNDGLGMGIQFERYLDSEKYFSFVMPIDLLVIANPSESNVSNSFVKNSIGIASNPSLRFYFRQPRSLNWYISFGLYGSSTNTSFDTTQYNNGWVNILNYNQFSFGTLTNIGFKSTINKRISLGAEFGMGLGLLHNYTIKYVDGTIYNSPNKIRALTNLNLQIGYNF